MLLLKALNVIFHWTNGFGDKGVDIVSGKVVCVLWLLIDLTIQMGQLAGSRQLGKQY